MGEEQLNGCTYAYRESIILDHEVKVNELSLQPRHLNFLLNLLE